MNGDDLHENFEFLQAGIQKGNSTRSELRWGEFTTPKVADEIDEVRKVSMFRGTAHETYASAACYNRNLSPSGAIV